MIKAEDLIRVEFSRSFLGYDMKEVDTLLDAVIEQVEAENGRVAFITSAMSEAEANAKINEAAASYSLVTRIRVL